MFSKCKNSKKKGDAGLGSAIGYFTLMGYTVCVPLTDSDDYDLVVDIDGLKKVQVKTTDFRNKRNQFEVGIKISGGNSKSNYISKTGDQIIYDLLYVLTASGEQYLIPKSVFANHKSSITLSKKYDEYRVCSFLCAGGVSG